MPNVYQPHALRALHDNLDEPLAAVIASVLNQDLHAIRLLSARQHFQAEDVRRIIGQLVQYGALIPVAETEPEATHPPQTDTSRSDVDRLPTAPQLNVEQARVDFAELGQALGVHESDPRRGDN